MLRGCGAAGAFVWVLVGTGQGAGQGAWRGDVVGLVRLCSRTHVLTWYGAL